MKATYNNKFNEIYYYVLTKNINLDKIKTSNAFIKALEETEDNPFLNTILKKEYFEITKMNNQD
jgi:hypothetical protein